jgi:hypothetical protein
MPFVVLWRLIQILGLSSVGTLPGQVYKITLGMLLAGQEGKDHGSDATKCHCPESILFDTSQNQEFAGCPVPQFRYTTLNGQYVRYFSGGTYEDTH